MDADGRTILIASLLCTQLLSSCATPLLPLAPGTAEIQDIGHGLVFGQIRIIRAGFDQMAHSFGKEFGWWLIRDGSGKRYVVRTLTREGPFALELPTGHYRVTGVIYDEGAGVWEGRVPASFTAEAGKRTYLGTWQIEFTFGGQSGKVSARVVNDFERLSPDQRALPDAAQIPLRIALLDSAKEGYFSLIELRIGM
jgi:hypothetical protein